MASTTLTKAKKEQDDEFYTPLPAIEKELSKHAHHFKNKTVYLNCDDPKHSQFYTYFTSNFKALRIRRLIVTGFPVEHQRKRCATIVTQDGVTTHPIKRDSRYASGDFRSKDCIALLKEADIVVTNPPFSLLREFILTVTNANKPFLIIAPITVLASVDVFPFVKEVLFPNKRVHTP